MNTREYIQPIERVCRAVLIGLTATLLWACSGSKSIDEPDPEPVVKPEEKPRPMGFVAMGEELSREATKLEVFTKQFQVWGTKSAADGTTQEVFPGYNVLYIDDTVSWQYDGTNYTDKECLNTPTQYLKYWDASADDYHFTAVAFKGNVVPTSDISVEKTASGLKITGGNTSNAASADCVVASHKRTLGASPADKDLLAPTVSPTPQPTDFYSIVPLRFHHIFAEVEFRVYNVGNTDANLSKLSVSRDDNIYTAVMVNADGITPVADSKKGDILTLSYETPLKVPKNTQKENAIKLGNSVYELVQTHPDGMRVLLEVNGSTPNKKSDEELEWEVDKKYIYYIKLDVSAGNPPILVDIICNVFEKGGEENLDESNW